MRIQEKPRACACLPPAGQPAPSITLHADGQDPGGNYAWSAADPAVARVEGSGSTAAVTPLQPGVTDIRVTYTRAGRQAQDTTRLVAYRAEIEHPTGDPVNNGSATNEFTFSAATPGALSIECRARITPADPDARACADENIRWSIDAVGNSALAWSTPDPADATRGKGATVTATFTGLPANTTDFGTKTVTMSIQGCGAPSLTTTIEVFYPKTARNHPNPGQGRTPNWFFYWMQVYEQIEGRASPNVRYGGHNANALGVTPGMLNWTYAAAQNRRRIRIHNGAARSDNAVPAIHGRLTGIDLCYNVLRHEREHVRQIRRANGIVGIHAGTCWRFGWSWNQARHNHWRLAVGRAAGAGGICTTAGPGTMGAAGSGDVSLQSAAAADWPAAWALPARPWAFGHPLEHNATLQETSREHRLARHDWGDPGKNHRTRNRYND